MDLIFPHPAQFHLRDFRESEKTVSHLFGQFPQHAFTGIAVELNLQDLASADEHTHFRTLGVLRECHDAIDGLLDVLVDAQGVGALL